VFVGGSTIDVVKQKPWQAGLRQAAVVGGGGGVLLNHAVVQNA
jgi:hypothetical protein